MAMMANLNPPRPYTEKEIEDIKELVNRLDDVLLYWFCQLPKCLVQFLRARDGNLDEAEKMIRNHLEWRRQEDMDTILMRWSPPPEFMEWVPWKICSFDQHGGPVVIFKIGLWEPANLKGRHDDLLTHLVYMLELGTRFLLLRTAHLDYVPETVVIADCEGLSWRHYFSYDGLQFVLKAMHIYLANYPEMLRVGIVVNVPFVFNMFYKLAKTVVPTTTLGKVNILYGKDKQTWKETIVKYIAEDKFPQEYGGTLEDDVVIQPELTEKEMSVAWLEPDAGKQYGRNGNECQG